MGSGRGASRGPTASAEGSGPEWLDAVSEAYDAAVEADPGVDPFCTRSDWILSFHRAFAPQRRVRVARRGDSYVALAGEPYRGGYVWEPLENMWGFASPLVGADAAELLGELLGDEPAVLSGLAPERAVAVARAFRRTHRAWRRGSVTRFVASLAGGLDGFLARRSRRFRHAARRARRDVADAGIAFARLLPRGADAARELYARMLRIEVRSWKAASEHPVDVGEMRDFYAHMLPRLAQGGRLRALVAHRGGEDVGYLYGGLVGGHFRGLQFSFDERVRHLALGNALQLEAIAWLCEQGASHYDLGTDSAYKRRWAEPGRTTVGLVLVPHG